MEDPNPLAQRRAQLNARQRERLLQRLRGSDRVDAVEHRIPARGLSVAPLSCAQKRLWFLWQLNGPDAAYHLGAVLKCSGALNPRAVQAALDAVIARHGSLRTVFRLDAEGVPEQHVQSPQAIALELLDLRDLAAGERTARAHAAAQVFHETPFDLARGPLLRVQWIRLGDDDHWLVMVMHHIVTDAWSKRIIIGEFVAGYNAHVHGRALELPVPALEYCDYARWEGEWLLSKERAEQLAYWQAHLDGASTVTQLPVDRPRRGDKHQRRGGVDCSTLPVASMSALARFAQGQQTSLFTVLLTGFFLVLQRYTGQSDLCVGVPIANRHRTETADVVGFFVNTQLLRCVLQPQETLRDVLIRVRDTSFAAQAHQDLPFNQLVEALRPESGGGSVPLFQVMFNHLKEDHAELQQLHGLELHEYANLRYGAQFDLSLDTTERADGSLAVVFTFDAELFDPGTIARFARHYRSALEQLVVQAQTPLHRLEFLEPREQEQLRHWGDNRCSCESDEPLHRAIERQAHVLPEATALCFREQTLSYGELNRRANQLAHRLIALGVRPESRVGIAVERSVEMVVGLLAILKAGGAYVPLDPEYPPARLAYMVEDSGIRLLLTQRQVRERIPVAEPLGILTLDDIDLQSEPEHDPQVPLHGDSLAYVIYTSGSTGRPKGAANRHRSLHNRLSWMQQAYALTPTDVVLQKTPFSFDVSVWEFFWPLRVGAQLVVAEPGAHRDAAHLVDLIRRRHVTTLHFVPSMLQAFLAHPGVEACESVTRMVCSGEALPAEVQREVLRRLPRAALYNLYGPTEAAIDVTHWTCRADDGNHVPIGRPIAGIRTCVLDAGLRLVPIGAPGELYLGGIGLARGYLNRAALTSERFVADPFSTDGERLYRTGDLARWNDAGQLEYLGRIDTQVKIRGLRIELGEIEAQLLAQQEVAEAVVVAKDSPSGPRLVAYVCAHGGQPLDTRLLREQLPRVLPDYMVPSVFVVLQALPLSPNGKIDRRALPDPDFTPPPRTYEAPQGDIETALAQIWSQVLGVEQIGRHDNFFELGGHSLLAAQMVARAQASLRVDLTVQDIFQLPRLADLAARAAASTHPAMDSALAQIDGFIDALEGA